MHSWDTLWDRYIYDWASELDMSVDDLLLEIEDMEGLLKVEVARWTPMRSW